MELLKGSCPGVKYCEGCREKCKDGQKLWNGWFCYEGLYHIECVPNEIRQKFGL